MACLTSHPVQNNCPALSLEFQACVHIVNICLAAASSRFRTESGPCISGRHIPVGSWTYRLPWSDCTRISRPVHGRFRGAVLGPPFTAGRAAEPNHTRQPRSRGFSLFGFSQSLLRHG